jgi:hypothetical protein
MFQGSFRPPFSKGGAHPRREALVASAEAKFPYGVFFLPSFFFAPLLPKKKRTVAFNKAILCLLFSLSLNRKDPIWY